MGLLSFGFPLSFALMEDQKMANDEVEWVKDVLDRTPGEIKKLPDPPALKSEPFAGTIEQAVRAGLSIPGWSNELTLRTLAECADEVFKKGAYQVVEIGVWIGRSLFPLTYMAKKHKKWVLGIDPYEKTAVVTVDDAKQAQLMANKAIVERGCGGFSDIFQARSLDIAPRVARYRQTSGNSKLVGMVHIDGDHDSAYLDLCAWAPIVMPGGYIMVHDAHTSHYEVAHDVLSWWHGWWHEPESEWAIDRRGKINSPSDWTDRNKEFFLLQKREV